MSALELNQLHKCFGTFAALDDVSLSVPSGSRTAIVGPSGSGKTTLLRLIAGFEFADHGSITLGGQALVDGKQAVPAHQRQIGYVPQDGALFPHLSVAANIGFGLPGSSAAKRAEVEALLDRVALDRRLLQCWPHELSGGQQQRVALARALAQRPRLMLLDEPFSALDTGLRASLRKAVAQVLGDAGITTVLVTHDQAEALSFADQLAVMRQGRLVQAGPPLELYRHPEDAQTAQFLGDAVLLPAQLEDGLASCALGHLPVRDRGLRGTAQVMLRPEQLHLCEQSPGAVRGVVSETDFVGNSWTLAVRLNGAGVTVIRLRSQGVEVPGVGSEVYVRAQGLAHVVG